MSSFATALGSMFSAILVQNAVAAAGELPRAPSTPSLFSTGRSMPAFGRGANSSIIAQARTPAPPAAHPAATPSAAPPAAAETRPPEKIETINFENWILTCRELLDGPKKRNCSMTVAVNKADTNQTIVSWTARQGDNGQLTSVIQTVPGVLLAPGIQLKLENAMAPRKIAFEVCEPNWCSGSVPMDKAFVQEVVGASKVTITVTSSNGQPFTLEFPIKGFEKAYAKM
jgi:invasion protein IalB